VGWGIQERLGGSEAHIGSNINTDGGLERIIPICAIGAHISILFKISYWLLRGINFSNKSIGMQQLILTFFRIFGIV
jgi:hypothetical protein